MVDWMLTLAVRQDYGTLASLQWAPSIHPVRLQLVRNKNFTGVTESGQVDTVTIGHPY